MENRTRKKSKILCLLLLAMAARWKGREVPNTAWAAPTMELLTPACRGRLHISFHRWVSRGVQTARRKRQKSHGTVNSVAPAFP